MSRITEAASQGSYDILGDLWIEALGEALPPAEMLQVFSTLTAAGRHDLSESLLELAVEELERAESASLPLLLTGAAPLFHRSETLRKSLVEHLRDAHLMFQPLELFLRESGLTRPGTDVSACWAEFSRLMLYDAGGCVYHPAYGPGRIVKVSRTSITIDFQKARDHEMNLDVALEMTIPISPDSLAMLRWKDPIELERLLREEPEVLLSRLLDEPFGGPGEISKSALAPVFGETGISQSDAWKALKKAAAAAPGISDLGETIARRSGEQSPTSQIRSILGDRKLPAREITLMVQSILGSITGVTTEEREELLSQAEGIRSSETGALFELAWVLSDSGRLPGFQRAAKAFMAKSAARIFRTMGEIQSPVCRKLYLESFLSGDADPEEKLQLLAMLKRPLWERCARFLEVSDPPLLEESLARFLSNPLETDSFLWALAYCAGSHRQTALPSGPDQLELFLKYLVYSRADTQKRVIGLLLSDLKVELNAYLTGSDTRKLLNLLESLEGSSTAHREGLHLAVNRELARRKESVPRIPGQQSRRFWETEHLFSGRKAIQARLDEMKRLRLVDIPTAAAAIGDAASHGDLSENAEYAAAIERRDLLLAKLKRWEEEIERYRPYPSAEMSPSISSPGTRLTLAAAGRPDVPVRILELVGPLEADPEKGRINYMAPLGAALLGRSPGDGIDLPGEKDLSWEILDIRIIGEDGTL